MKYRPEIDGLRSVAVLPVILFHGGLELFSGGFVGVDVFFVISGYLISTIILSEIREDHFSLLRFYVRRARRILPALVLVVLVTIPFAWVWMLPTQFKDFAQSIAAVGLFSSNFLFWIESSYFAPAAEEKPLLHTWSLAVEEQYYIFFPLLLLLLRRVREQALAVVLICLLILSLGASEVMWRTAPDANFYLLPTRAWELLAGSLCAMLVLHRGARANHALSLAGLALIAWAIFAFDAATPFPSLYALVPVAGTCLIILYGARGSAAAWALSLRAPVAIGLISYSAYLWHQPLFALARLQGGHTPPQALMMALALTSLGLAWLSWKFVEQPFRRGAMGEWRVMGVTAGVTAGFVALALVLGYSGLHNRYFLNTLSPENRGLADQVAQLQTMNHFATEDAGACRFYVEDPDASVTARFARCHAQHGPALLIVGDSHSIDVYKGLIVASDRPFLVGLGQGQCRPHVAGSDCSFTPMPRFLRAHADQIALAVYVQAGFWLMTDAEGRERARFLFTNADGFDPKLNDAAIARTLAVLGSLNDAVPVAWLGPRLEPHVGMEEILGIECSRAPELLALRPGHREIFTRLDTYLAAGAARAGIGYISEIDAVGFDIATDLYTCQNLFWSDGDHWSPAGEAVFGSRLSPAIKQVLNRTLADPQTVGHGQSN